VGLLLHCWQLRLHGLRACHKLLCLLLLLRMLLLLRLLLLLLLHLLPDLLRLLLLLLVPDEGPQLPDGNVHVVWVPQQVCNVSLQRLLLLLDLGCLCGNNALRPLHNGDQDRALQDLIHILGALLDIQADCACQQLAQLL
jgi:hypothetical protein